MIERLLRCNRAIRGAPENDDRVNSEIHSKAVIERVWRWNGSIRGEPENDDQVNSEIHSEAVVAGKSVSHHHHHHSAWQRTELRRVYLDTGMMETDWATGAYGDTGVAEMDGVTGGIYSRDPGEIACIASCILSRIISSHLISLYNELHTTSFASFNLTCSVQHFVDPRCCVDPHSRVVSYILTLFLRSSSQNRSFSRIPCGMA